MTRLSWPTTGAASARSRPLPCGSPSTMSTRTTSARPASAMRWAVVAPTLPGPMPGTWWRGIGVGLRRASAASVDAWAGLANRGRETIGVQREIIRKHPGQHPRLLVIGSRIRPRRARLEELRGDVGAGRRHRDTEDRVADGRNTVERAAQRGANHRPGVVDVHPLAGAVRAAGPAGVHEPDRDVRAGQPLAQHPRVLAGMARHERRPEAGGGGGFR